MPSVGARVAQTIAAAAAMSAALALAGCGEPEAQPKAAGTPVTELRPPGDFAGHLAAQRGRGVVVNQWASWCKPCRQEFPLLAQAARRYRGRVAFIGIASRDSRRAATAFLATSGPGFAQFLDPGAELARGFRGGRVWPTTAFYTPGGRLNTTHQGVYPTLEQLDADIQRYALDG